MTAAFCAIYCHLFKWNFAKFYVFGFGSLYTVYMYSVAWMTLFSWPTLYGKRYKVIV